MYWNRFDIVEAYYLFYTHYHEGQWSEKYARLSKIGTYFRPAMGLSYESMDENGREIYDSLVEREETKKRSYTKKHIAPKGFIRSPATGELIPVSSLLSNR